MGQNIVSQLLWIIRLTGWYLQILNTEDDSENTMLGEREPKAFIRTANIVSHTTLSRPCHESPRQELRLEEDMQNQKSPNLHYANPHSG